MFNFQNMNDYEFELLCKDILESELDTKLRTYKKGRDGGIDISCFMNNSTIAQVKHYINSSYSNMKYSLKQELNKLRKLSPKNYYVFTSLGLSPSNVNEIYGLFSDYMDSINNIYDSTRINDILLEDKNIDIVNKHYKLWLTSTNVLGLVNNRNIFIDTEELMFDIQNESKFFVETKGYYDSLNILEKEGIIIIQGDPGVGKTTISKMLLLYYSTKGYCIRYASDSSVKDIKKSLTLDNEKKEIVLLDDFLGQHYLNLKEEKPNEIKTLVSYILRNKNKKLILNSRITILNEAFRKNLSFKNFIEDSKIQKYIIDLNKMPVDEKAKILYNHIYFNNLPLDYFNQIKYNKRYVNIIKHPNYNPRIIEYVTKERNYRAYEPAKYYNYIMGKLENPDDVWKDEFENRIDRFDRIFMHTLYSLTDTYIDESILKECLNKRIENEKNYDSTIDLFSACLIRLTQSMVKIIEEKDKIKIGVINPSINDYIYNSLLNNENEVKNILENSIYIEQINRIRKINKEISYEITISRIENDEFLKMKSIKETPEYYLLEFIYNNKYKSQTVRKLIFEIIANENTYYGLTVIQDIRSNLLKSFFSNEELFNFYNLESLIFDFNKMEIVFDMLNLDALNVFLEIYDNYYKQDRENDWVNELEWVIEERLTSCIEDEVFNEIENNKDYIIDNVIDESSDDIIIAYQTEDDDSLLECVKNALLEEIEMLIYEKKSKLKSNIIEIEKLEVSSEEILEEIDYAAVVDSYFRDEPYYDDYYERPLKESSLETIYEIFERDYSA